VHRSGGSADVQAASHIVFAAAILVVQPLSCLPMFSPTNRACMLVDKLNCSLVESTNWRNAAILDHIDYLVRSESALKDQEKVDLRILLKLEEITSMSKNKVDAVCTALMSSALWMDRSCKLTAEAIEWLRTELDEISAEAQVAGNAPYTLQFNKC
jgi:hypothetical protein